MRLVQHRPGRRLVDAARFQPNHAILDQHRLTDAVPPRDRVEPRDQLDAVQSLIVQADRNAAFEFDRHVFGGIGRRRHRARQYVTIVGGLLGGIFDFAALMRHVPDIGVARIDFLRRSLDRHVVGLGIIERGFAAVELELRVLPRRDNFQVRRQRHVSQFESDLIVALAGGAVSHRIGTSSRATVTCSRAISGRATAGPSM